MEFIYPFSSEVKSFVDLNFPIVISNPIQFETTYKNLHADLLNKIEIFKSDKIEKLYKNSGKNNMW